MGKSHAFGFAIKEEIGTFDGLIPIPKDDQDKEEELWEINTLVNPWILNTMEPSLRSSMNYTERVDELWAYLKERFFCWKRNQENML